MGEDILQETNKRLKNDLVDKKCIHWPVGQRSTMEITAKNQNLQETKVNAIDLLWVRKNENVNNLDIKGVRNNITAPRHQVKDYKKPTPTVKGAPKLNNTPNSARIICG